MTSPRGHAARTAQLRIDALALRQAGKTYRTIAAELGIGRNTAYRAVRDAMDDLRAESVDQADEYRTLQYERLESMYLVLHERIAKGDLAAIAMGLKIIDSEAKLFGLYVHHVTVDTSTQITIESIDYRDAIEPLKPLEIE